jgi:hypothetical protein
MKNDFTEDPQILGATVQNLFAWATWPVGFVHPRHRHPGITYDDNGVNVNTF